MNAKKCISLIFLLFLICNSIIAQIRLDVEGDAKILGKMDIRSETDAFSSLFIGNNAGNMDDGENNNTFVGVNAGRVNSSGNLNTFVGKDAGQANTIGLQNTFIGRSAGFTNLEGEKNTFVGRGAGYSNKNGNENTFIGGDAGVVNDANNNTFIGFNAGRFSNSGTDNTFLGREAGKNNRGGNNNTFIGEQAGFTNTGGGANTFVGEDTGYTSTGGSNTLIGKSAGYANKAGTQNTFLGYQAGFLMEDGMQNTFLGTLAGGTSPTGDARTKSIAIGYNAKVGCNGCAVIGGTGTNSIRVGIGTTNPDFTFDVTHGQGEPDINGPTNGLQIKNGVGGKDWQFYVTTNTGDLAVYYQKVRKGRFDSANGRYFYGANAFTSTNPSTARLTNQLSVIQKLEPLSYQPAGRSKKNKLLGLNPEKVQNIIPHLVKTDRSEDGNKKYYYLDYDSFIPILISAIKEQQLIIDNQKDRVEKQQQQINQQQAQINDLKSLIEKLIVTSNESSNGNFYQLNLEQKAFLAQNQPNPFSKNTLIQYEIPDKAQAAFLQLTNVEGKVLGIVKIDHRGKGQVEIKANAYPIGTYYYSLIVDGEIIETKRMVLTK